MQLVPAAAGALDAAHLDTAGYVKQFYDANVSLAGQQTMFIDKFIATVLADKKLTEEAKSRIIALAMNDRLLYQNKPKTNTTSTTVVVPSAPVPVPVTPPGSPKPKPRKPKKPKTPKLEVKSEDEYDGNKTKVPRPKPRPGGWVIDPADSGESTSYGSYTLPGTRDPRHSTPDSGESDEDDIPAARGGHIPLGAEWEPTLRRSTRSKTRGGYSLPSEDEDSTDEDSDDGASIFGGALESTIRAAMG